MDSNITGADDVPRAVVRVAGRLADTAIPGLAATFDHTEAEVVGAFNEAALTKGEAGGGLEVDLFHAIRNDGDVGFEQLIGRALVNLTKESAPLGQQATRQGRGRIRLWSVPYNPASGVRFTGINMLKLMGAGARDARWMTRQQAALAGYEVAPGARGEQILLWSNVSDGGSPGPQVSRAVVFNGADIFGLPQLNHQAAGKAWRTGDVGALGEICRQSADELAIYDGTHPYGSEGRARADLSVAIATLMLSHDLGFDVKDLPKQDYNSVVAWKRFIEEDPLEFFRASVEAEEIARHVIGRGENRQEKASRVDRQNDGSAEMTRNTERVYLAVPYDERTEAKAAGARWDETRKSWYAPIGADLAQIERWRPSSEPVGPAEEFAKFLSDRGFVVPGKGVQIDGKDHRVGVVGKKDGNKDGSYRAYLDGIPAGTARNFATGETFKWVYKGFQLTEAQKAALQATAAEKAQQRMRETLNEQLRAQARVRHQISGLQTIDAAGSPERVPTYLRTKGLRVHDGVLSKPGDNTLYVPLIDTRGVVWSMQYIQEDGTKRLAKESKMEGCFHAVGGMEALDKAPFLVIAEGYSTAAVIAETTGIATVSAISAGNLTAVARALRDRFPDKPIVIAGDDDTSTTRNGQPYNVGKIESEQAAAAVNGVAITPTFAQGEVEKDPKGMTDFHDMARKSDGGEVRMNDLLRRAHMQAKLQLQLTEELRKKREAERLYVIKPLGNGFEVLNASHQLTPILDFAAKFDKDEARKLADKVGGEVVTHVPGRDRAHDSKSNRVKR
jgi:phage/plasmid primase-like uncharacterized protein/antirestriction protein ArdC